MRAPLRLLSNRSVSTRVTGRCASSLVVAEHDTNKKLTPGSLSTITAATKIGGDVSVLVVGKGIADVASHASKIAGVTKVLTLENDVFEHLLPEDFAPVLAGLAKNYTHILAPSNNNSKNYLPRAAALNDAAPLGDVLSVQNESTFTRPVYAGNAIATVQMSDAVKFISIRTTAFEKAAEGSASAPVEAVKDVTVSKSGKSQFLSANVAKSDRPDLSTARVVVSGGRGLKSGENFKILETLADKLGEHSYHYFSFNNYLSAFQRYAGGAVGASRAAVDAGFVPNEYQVGQTGKVVAPDLYIAVRILSHTLCQFLCITSFTRTSGWYLRCHPALVGHEGLEDHCCHQ